MLRPIDQYNQFSPALRKTLNELRASFGKTVRYKFYIAQKNPDAEHVAAGEYIYPGLYSLTPTTYSVLDPGDGAYKDVGMTSDKIRNTTSEVQELHFRRIEVVERDRGIITLDLTSQRDVEAFEYIEMHPKLEGGMFRDKNYPAMVARIDDLKEAKTKLKARELRVTALMVASKMAEQEVRDFAAAMNWNEFQDLDILREKLTALAESDPEFFKKFVDDPQMESKAVVKRALDSNTIAWIPVENKFVWGTNGATIAMLDRIENGNYIDQMADWFMSHKNGQEVYKKIKSAISGK